MDKLFQRWASKEFYDKFVEGGYKLTGEIQQEWIDTYVKGVGSLVPMGEFLEWVDSLQDEYHRKFSKRKTYLHYKRFASYMMMTRAPKFKEQFDDELTKFMEKI